MVAQITEGTAFDKRGRPFHRRNVVPGLCMLAVLAVLTMSVWIYTLTRPLVVEEAVACNPPPPQTDPAVAGLGERVSVATMTTVAPAKLADSNVVVLNASGRGGQAAEVAAELRDLGFAQPGAANDLIYAGDPLTCHGQIRFGPGGQAAAAAVWLVAPCTELYQDDRTDATVDLAIGSGFTELTHSDDIDAVLAGLRPDATEPADSTLLAKIHNASC
ncbi:MAG: envelope integrity protein Cei [Mycobacterium sp.]